jgi:hypothetical protein
MMAMMLLAKSVMERLEWAVLVCAHMTLSLRWMDLGGILVSTGSLEILALVSMSASITYIEVATHIVRESPASKAVETALGRHTIE